MNKILSCLLILVFVATGNAQETTKETPAVKSFKAGGIPIVIPAPTRDMVEVGYDNREIMEILVPSTNRLLAAFVPTDDLPRLTKGDAKLVMSKYGMAQVPRRGEHMDCRTSDFKIVTDKMKKQFGNIIGSATKEAEEEFNRRMKSLDLDEATMSLGKPTQIGCLFSKQDAYGFGMIMPVSIGGDTITMGMGAALLRINKRLIFVYLYAEYESEETVKWLRKMTEEWADAILKQTCKRLNNR